MNYTPEPIRRLAEDFLVIVYGGIFGLLAAEFVHGYFIK